MRLKKEMAMLEESFMDLRQLNFELRSVRHDYLNHLQVVYGLMELEEYEELKKWAIRTQLQFPTYKINIYPIMVNAPIFEREKRMISKASTDEDIYKMCTKFIAERYEFNTVIKENPEIIPKKPIRISEPIWIIS